MKRFVFSAAPVAVAGCMFASANDASTGDAPVAVISDPFATSLVGRVVVIDASDSYDPDNAAPAPPHGIVRFHWVLESKPAGSAAAINGTSGTATFEVDIQGDYGGHVVVEDADGLTSEPSPFGVTAVLPSGFHAQVTWDIDRADVDLHVLYVTTGATFGEAPWDCFYGNTQPPWGAKLTLDDSEGYGPEDVVLDEIGGTARLMVIVYYFSDDGMGATTATLRLLDEIGGEVYSDSGLLSGTGKRWDVIYVDLPSFEISVLDDIYSQP